MAGTACTLTDVLYGVPAGGTMAHSWVQMFPTEYDAFKTYCELYPDNATLLVDTYNTLKSGVPNAIRAFKEILLPRGRKNEENFVIVSVNGRSWKIMKGVEVQVPDFVAEVLENAQMMADDARRYVDRMAN